MLDRGGIDDVGHSDTVHPSEDEECVYIDPPDANGAIHPRADQRGTGPSGLFILYARDIFSAKVDAGGKTRTVMMLIGRIRRTGGWWYAGCDALGTYTQGAMAMLADCVETLVGRFGWKARVTAIAKDAHGKAIDDFEVLVDSDDRTVLLAALLEHQLAIRGRTVADFEDKLGVAYDPQSEPALRALVAPELVIGRQP